MPVAGLQPKGRLQQMVVCGVFFFRERKRNAAGHTYPFRVFPWTGQERVLGRARVRVRARHVVCVASLEGWPLIISMVRVEGGITSQRI